MGYGREHVLHARARSPRPRRVRHARRAEGDAWSDGVPEATRASRREDYSSSSRTQPEAMCARRVAHARARAEDLRARDDPRRMRRLSRDPNPRRKGAQAQADGTAQATARAHASRRDP